MAEMSIAGTVREYNPVGFWWSSMPEEQWPQDKETQEYITSNWHPLFGDRYQKLIFIGKPEILEDIRRSLENSLVTDEEVEKGSEYCQQLPDPFNDWTQYVPSTEDVDDAV